MDITFCKPDVACRDQILPEEIAAIAAAGFRGIINNRPDGESPDQPSSDLLAAEATRHGLHYWHIPVTPGHASDADARAFAAALRTADGPVVAFCRTGSRSAALAEQVSHSSEKGANSMTNVSALSLENDALVAKAMESVIRFREMRPSFQAAPDGNPAWQITGYKYTDGQIANLCTDVPPAVLSEEFRLVGGIIEPGRGAPLHNHTGEELIFVVSGTFAVFFDEEEKNKVYLEPWDAILLPANVARGWRNVGRELGCMLNLNGVQDKMTTVSSGNAA